MGKKPSTSVIPAPASSSKKAVKLTQQQKNQSTSNSTSIDDIFAAPKKRKADEPVKVDKKKNLEKSKSSTNEPEKKKKKIGGPVIEKNDKPTKKSVDEESEDSDEFDDEEFEDLEDFDDDEEQEERLPQRKVEEIIDPSSLAEIRKKIEAAKATSSKGGKKIKSNKDREDDALFADSRGTGTGRKTEEGYVIYKEADLQIDPTAGGTPLCPFDCDCCF
ncbi:uncharacterized protein L199_006426 [Kwoniella botswanensis]|uniref:uncharacterized protein n=1 Tax=Kwoniella botswanensis TaxID=1268659 RepID=UPI00315DA5B4